MKGTRKSKYLKGTEFHSIFLFRITVVNFTWRPTSQNAWVDPLPKTKSNQVSGLSWSTNYFRRSCRSTKNSWQWDYRMTRGLIFLTSYCGGRFVLKINPTSVRPHTWTVLPINLNFVWHCSHWFVGTVTSTLTRGLLNPIYPRENCFECYRHGIDLLFCMIIE